MIINADRQNFERTKRDKVHRTAKEMILFRLVSAFVDKYHESFNNSEVIINPSGGSRV